jgi:hypothetical protein
LDPDYYNFNVYPHGTKLDIGSLFTGSGFGGVGNMLFGKVNIYAINPDKSHYGYFEFENGTLNISYVNVDIATNYHSAVVDI